MQGYPRPKPRNNSNYCPGIVDHYKRFRLSTTIWWAEGDLSVLELVKRGLGWASVPAFLLTDALARGEVVRLADAALPPIPALPIELLWPSARALGPAAQWLRQALQAHRL